MAEQVDIEGFKKREIESYYVEQIREKRATIQEEFEEHTIRSYVNEYEMDVKEMELEASLFDEAANGSDNWEDEEWPESRLIVVNGIYVPEAGELQDLFEWKEDNWFPTNKKAAHWLFI